MKNLKSEQPAYPSMDMNSHYGVDRLELRYEGLSKREYATIMILQGMLAGRDDHDSPMESNFVEASIHLADELFDKINH